MSQTKISCIKCKNLWIGIVIGIVALVFLGIGIFDSKVYSDNYYYISDGLRYSGIIGLIGFCCKFSHYNIKRFCSKPYTIENGGNGGRLENLGWGIGLAVITITLTMILINYLPMTLQEWEVRSDDYSTESILELDCKTLNSNKIDNWGYDDMFYGLDNNGVGGTQITERFKECD